jgi:hypothetical protein
MSKIAVFFLLQTGIFLWLWSKRPRFPLKGNFREASFDPLKDPILQVILDEKSTDWDVLGLNPSASVRQIKEAYRERMKRFHPDHAFFPESLSQKAAIRLTEAKNRLVNI